MVFGRLCAPALIYIVFSITQITMDSLKGLYNVAFVKLFISLLFTILLNHLCQRGLGIISWIIVFIPFMLMSLIVALLLTVFGLDPKTGKLNATQLSEKDKKELDAREKAILNYGMNRSKDDYMKRLAEMGYLDLKGKGGQNLINPAYNPVYGSTKGTSKYDLIKSGGARNRLRTRILAEELYYKLKGKVSTNVIKLETDVGGKVRKIFIENCDVAIDVFYEDLYYRLSKIYGVFDLKESDQSAKIQEALEDMKNWGVLRNSSGRVVAFNNFDVNNFRKYTEQLDTAEPAWAASVVTKWKTRIESKYESKCTKIQIKINEYAQAAGIDFSDIYKNKGESTYTSLFDKAYSSSLLNSNFVPPTSCTTKLSTLCKLRKRGECRPCNKGTEFIEGTDSATAKVACPFLCEASDLDLSNTANNLNKSKLCGYCSLCTGAAAQDIAAGTSKRPPAGKSWVSLNQITNSALSPSITTLPIPKKFEDVGTQKGAGNVDWWKLKYPSDVNKPEASVNIRSCSGDTTRVLDQGTLYARAQTSATPAAQTSATPAAQTSATPAATTSGTTHYCFTDSENLGTFKATDVNNCLTQCKSTYPESSSRTGHQCNAAGYGPTKTHYCFTNSENLGTFAAIDANNCVTQCKSTYPESSSRTGHQCNTTGYPVSGGGQINLTENNRTFSGVRSLPTSVISLAFSAADTDSDGKLTIAELNAAASQFGISVDSAKLTELVTKFGTTTAGSVTLAELNSIIPKINYCKQSMLDSNQAWCAENNTATDQYVELDLSTTKTLKAIVTQGRKDRDEWVKTYKVRWAPAMGTGISTKTWTTVTDYTKVKTPGEKVGAQLSGSGVETWVSLDDAILKAQQKGHNIGSTLRYIQKASGLVYFYGEGDSSGAGGPDTWRFDPTSTDKIFNAVSGTGDKNIKVTNNLPSTVQARYVRIIPQTWNVWPSMRVGVIASAASPSEGFQNYYKNPKENWGKNDLFDFLKSIFY